MPIKWHTLRNRTAQDARAIRDHMRRALDDPDFGTPAVRELAGVRRAQEWTGRRIVCAPREDTAMSDDWALYDKDGDAEPICPECETILEWVVCGTCDDGDPIPPCAQCGGAGGWYWCATCVKEPA